MTLTLSPDELLAMGIPEFEPDYEKWMARSEQPWVTAYKQNRLLDAPLTQPRLIPDSIELHRPAAAGCSVRHCGAQVVGAVEHRSESRAACQAHGERLVRELGYRWVVRRD